MEIPPVHIQGFLGGTYPYRATLVLPGGLSLTVQTYHHSSDPKEFLEAAKPISKFLARSFLLLGKQDGNESGSAAIIGYEE